MPGRRALPLLLLALGGCTSAVPAAVAPDGSAVEQALRAAQPGPLLELPSLLDALLPPEDDCLLPEILAVDEQGIPVREAWSGTCRVGDLLIEGALERLDRPDEQWLAGENFSISRVTAQGTVQEVFLDGAVEVVEQEDLLLVDASATWCGGPDAPCDDGPVTVDLSFSLFPADGYPDAYDVTVSGVVARQVPIMVEGSWTTDLAACDREPTDGVFALRRGDRHDLILDGAERCDACATWTVQGLDAPAFCTDAF